MDVRMWTYPELRFVYVSQRQCSASEVADRVNLDFHGGEQVRTAVDVEKVWRGRNIFNKNSPI